MSIKKILIVEDEIILAMSCKKGLEKLGYEVLKLTLSGEEAIEEAAISKPDLVLMDLTLQGKLDGLATAAKIYENQKTPVVFVTAHSDKDTLNKIKNSNCVGHLIKPFDINELSNLLKTL